MKREIQSMFMFNTENQGYKKASLHLQLRVMTCTIQYFRHILFSAKAVLLTLHCSVIPSTLLVLFSPSVCLSIALTYPLCLGEIHMSCLTAHCHVYPGRSALCNLKLVLNAQPCLYIERRLLREGERYREKKNTARKRQLEIG